MVHCPGREDLVIHHEAETRRLVLETMSSEVYEKTLNSLFPERKVRAFHDHLVEPDLDACCSLPRLAAARVVDSSSTGRPVCDASSLTLEDFEFAVITGIDPERRNASIDPSCRDLRYIPFVLLVHPALALSVSMSMASGGSHLAAETISLYRSLSTARYALWPFTPQLVDCVGAIGRILGAFDCISHGLGLVHDQAKLSSPPRPRRNVPSRASEPSIGTNDSAVCPTDFRTPQEPLPLDRSPQRPSLNRGVKRNRPSEKRRDTAEESVGRPRRQDRSPRERLSLSADSRQQHGWFSRPRTHVSPSVDFSPSPLLSSDSLRPRQNIKSPEIEQIGHPQVVPQAREDEIYEEIISLARSLQPWEFGDGDDVILSASADLLDLQTYIAPIEPSSLDPQVSPWSDSRDASPSPSIQKLALPPVRLVRRGSNDGPYDNLRALTGSNFTDDKILQLQDLPSILPKTLDVMDCRIQRVNTLSSVDALAYFKSSFQSLAPPSNPRLIFSEISTGDASTEPFPLPDILTRLDWAARFGPSPRAISERSDAYISRQYCIADAGAVTRWHVEFNGSSTILAPIYGSKLVMLVRPTAADLVRLCSASQSMQTFDTSELEVIMVKISRGDLLYLPPAWPHAVVTTRPSLMISFNFYTDYAIPQQTHLSELLFFFQQEAGSLEFAWLAYRALQQLELQLCVDPQVQHSDSVPKRHLPLPPIAHMLSLARFVESRHMEIHHLSLGAVKVENVHRTCAEIRKWVQDKTGEPEASSQAKAQQ